MQKSNIFPHNTNKSSSVKLSFVYTNNQEGGRYTWHKSRSENQPEGKQGTQERTAGEGSDLNRS